MALSPFRTSAANQMPGLAPQSISFQDWQVRLMQSQQIIIADQGRNTSETTNKYHHPSSATATQSQSQPQSPTSSSLPTCSSSSVSCQCSPRFASNPSSAASKSLHLSVVTRYSSLVKPANNNNNIKGQSPNTLAASLPRRHHARKRIVHDQNATRLGYFEPHVSKHSSLDTIIIGPPSSILITSEYDFFSPEPIINNPLTYDCDSSRQSPTNSVRSLILPMSAAVASINAGDQAGTESPGSPPELTDSKSSKSSSFHSCGLADANVGDLSNFEDISLDEIASIHDANKHLDNIHSTAAQFYRHAPQSNKTVRDLTHSSSRPLSNLSNGLATTSSTNSARSNKYQLPVPGPRSNRNNLRQSSQVSLHIQSQTKTRSRSPSPSSAVRNLRTFSPTSNSLPTSYSSGGRSTNFTQSSFPHRKRQTLQSRKKSVQELEREFDELDDELPDDAVIYNVPISPRPAHERGFSSASTAILESSSLPGNILSPNSSHNFSGQSSPERRSPRQHWSNNGVPVGFAEPSPISPGLSEVSADFTRPVSATKSREVVYGDLNREARELTQALELYAEESAAKYERDVQSGTISPAKSTALSPISSISTELPPVRKSDPLIDPLPVSREKEQFLTRTRPSWLPPKSRKEEKRHLKEYQKLMARAAEAERKAAQKAHKLQLERDHAASERAKIWETEILQTWESALTQTRTRNLWWSGLPTQNRGTVWRKAVGNQLGLTADSFEAILTRVRDVDAAVESLPEEAKVRDPLGHIFVGLKEDASTVFPELSLFQEGGPLNVSLLEVCKVFALYRSNIEWDYGIMTLAALLLVNMQSADAFITLANIFNRPLPSAILTHESTTLATTYNTILAMIAFKRPQLHSHLITLRNLTADGQPIWENASVASPISPSTQIPPDSSLPPRPRSPSPSAGPLLDPAVYLFPVLHGICSASPRLSIEAASRLWDVIVFEGDVAIVRAAVAVIGRLESRLYSLPIEILDELDKPRWDIGDTDSFMLSVRSMENMTDDL